MADATYTTLLYQPVPNYPKNNVLTLANTTFYKFLILLIKYIIIHIRIIPIVLPIIGILCGCFQNLPLSAQTMKTHHLADGTFRNNYLESTDKSFSSFFKVAMEQGGP